MITLTRVIAKSLSTQKEREQRMVLLGLDRGGKTQLFEWAQEALFHQPHKETDIPNAATPYTATSGASVARGSYRKHRYSITDLGGLPKKRSTWADYYSDADVVFWSVNIAEEEQRARLKESVSVLKNALASDFLEACPVCIVVACAGANSDTDDDRIEEAQECFSELIEEEKSKRDISIVFADVSDESHKAKVTRYLEAFDWFEEVLRGRGERITHRQAIIPDLVQRSLAM